MTIEELIAKIRSYLALRSRGGVTCTPPLAQPARDWQLVLGLSLVLFMCAAVFAALTYAGGMEAREQAGDTTLSGPVFDESVFSQTLAKMQARAARHEQVRAQ